MGGRSLHAKFFIGPNVMKTHYEWIILFLRKREDIIKEIREEETYKKFMEGREDDPNDEELNDVIISDWYICDGRINDDIEKLHDFLRSHGMMIVHTSSFGAHIEDEIRIGRVLQEDTLTENVKPSEKDIEFWKSYGISEEDFVVFPGLY